MPRTSSDARVVRLGSSTGVGCGASDKGGHHTRGLGLRPFVTTSLVIAILPVGTGRREIGKAVSTDDFDSWLIYDNDEWRSVALPPQQNLQRFGSMQVALSLDPDCDIQPVSGISSAVAASTPRNSKEQGDGRTGAKGPVIAQVMPRV